MKKVHIVITKVEGNGSVQAEAYSTKGLALERVKSLALPFDVEVIECEIQKRIYTKKIK